MPRAFGVSVVRAHPVLNLLEVRRDAGHERGAVGRRPRPHRPQRPTAMETVCLNPAPHQPHLELLEPSDSSSIIGRFLEKRSGLHHICLLVDDIEKSMAEMKSAGAQLLDEVPRIGAGGCRVAFIHPKSAAGVLLELKEA